ncbi:hypothetical protein [Micromonospora endolithica]|uniref:Uncharacterized protein n=1 Tax=Micromonospora endolithica TaxID=230091 RepID=A0A3A9YVU8_9ACTN|nr:hypothetical protein [Micromonospora endolithica]RKN40192.1 hypothetical protein D7223_26620 [Micromonospora endolithica]TWJ22494.1 hypothetical protein JD76_02614 [Micromonospora endolithica]
MTAILNPTGTAPFTPPVRPAAAAAGPPDPVVPLVGPVLALPGDPAAALVPVTWRGRPVGAFVATGGRVRYRPVVDPDQLLAAAAGVLGLGLLAAGAAVVARRRAPAIGSVRMGPGGWVSLKGLPLPAPRAPRPWWARALRARRLVVQP